eukprot:5698577-Amphidinium_carterae.1
MKWGWLSARRRLTDRYVALDSGFSDHPDGRAVSKNIWCQVLGQAQDLVKARLECRATWRTSAA